MKMNKFEKKTFLMYGPEDEVRKIDGDTIKRIGQFMLESEDESERKALLEYLERTVDVSADYENKKDEETYFSGILLGRLEGIVLGGAAIFGGLSLGMLCRKLIDKK